MKRGMIFVIITAVALMLEGCSWAYNLSEAMVSLRVISESGEPIDSADIRVGFERPDGKSHKIMGFTDAKGIFNAKDRTVQDIAYHVTKKGYYESYGEYRFLAKEGSQWQPWNKEFTVVLRKIENPVPMYAFDLFGTKTLELPEPATNIGYDLIERDWVTPFGKGTHADFVFRIDRKFVSNQEYDGTLTVTFTSKYDGIIQHKQSRKFGSNFKLPRYAPEDGYKDKMTVTIKSSPGKTPIISYSDDNNYFFRIRSEEKDGRFYRAMHGKIHGDIVFDLMHTKTANIGFKYYINPDYTRNLEFDPKRNLYKNLNKSDYVGLE